MGISKWQLDDTTTPVFGLTKGQLMPVVESVAGEPVAWFGVSIGHALASEHYGGRGEKVIPTFEYRTQRGRTGMRTIFAKQHCNTGPNEALHYKWLTEQRAPIPRIYWAISGTEARDIIFLEQIDPFTGDEERFVSDDDTFLQFLSLTARFNAIRPCEEYAARLPCKLPWMGCETLVSTLEGFWEHAVRGEAGEEVKRICSEDELVRLVKVAGRMAEPIACMKQALSHWDHRPNNMGWRKETGEMVIFDLEDTMIGPWFDDVADWLGAPDIVQQRCRPREELTRHYVEQLERWGGERAAVEELLEETYVLWILHALRSLDWWLRYGGVFEESETSSETDQPEHRFRSRDKLCRELHGLVTAAAMWQR